MTDRLQLEASWKALLRDEFDEPYMQNLRAFLVARRQSGKIIFPRPAYWFRALNETPVDQVRVVILGQDPYHGPGQAEGLCFSVPPGQRIPPSLVNIFKELKEDIGMTPPRSGCLLPWAKQGVLLLNSVLTVEAGQAGSHRGQGWERFTDMIVQKLNAGSKPLIFLLWGSYAHKKAAFVDAHRHCILKAAHPSPLSAHNGFFGCRHFSRANHFLEEQGQAPIDWRLDQV